METVPGGQFFWGGTLLKCNGGAYQGRLGADGNRAGRAKAEAGLTARPTSCAGAKAELSDPTTMLVCFIMHECFIGRLEITDKSYSGDNRLVESESPYRRLRSAPRCRLTTSRGWRRSQGYGCSPFKVVRELGSNRRETGWSLSTVGVDI